MIPMVTYVHEKHIMVHCIHYFPQVLKAACVDALKRIFNLCDVNKDGVLDTAELNEFQVRFVFIS